MLNETTGAPPAPAERTGLARADLLVAAVLAAAVFSGNYAIERTLDRYKVLTQYDILFNADPITRLHSISHGQGDPNDMIIHPGLRVYFSRPIRLMGKVARATGLIPNTGRAEHDLRRSLALLVVPAVSGLTMAATYALFLASGLTRPRALLMAVVCCASFSQLVFGSLPDHMPVSALAVVTLLLLAAEMVRRGGEVRWFAWPLVGGVYTATTVTNAAPFTILFTTALALSGRPLARVARDGAIVVTAMLGVAGAFAVAGRYIVYKTPWPVQNVRNHAASYQKRDWAKAPGAMLETFAPAGLVTVQLGKGIRESNFYSSGGRFTPGIATAETWPANAVAFFTALTLAGAAACVRAGGVLRVVGAASAGVLAFNLALHSVWGDAFFLYSQHWLIPLAVLLAGNLAWPGRVGRGFAVGYAVAGVALFVHNGTLLNEIFTVVAGTFV